MMSIVLKGSVHGTSSIYGTSCLQFFVCITRREIHIRQIILRKDSNTTLTLRGGVTHIFVSRLDNHVFRKWLVACSVQSHYLNQWWPIVNYTLRNIFHWNIISISQSFVLESAFEYFVCEMTAILSQPQYVDQNWHTPTRVMSYFIQPHNGRRWV